MKITYRIMELKDDPNGDKYGLFEIYEHANGRISHPEQAELYGNDLHHMKLEVDLMMQAFELPVLKL